jgi:uncharacterized protein
MEIYEGIKIVDLGLYIEKEKVLIISDLQLGYEESMNRKGVFIPRIQFDLIKKRLEKIFERVSPNIVIINGDLKHEFGTINNQEWNDSLSILYYIQKNCKKIILVKGNHDWILGPIAKKRNIELVESYVIRNICILHGHKILLDSLNYKILIIGHEHPAISLKEDSKVEKYKCFLKGKFDDKTLIVMPSFNMLNEGSDVLNENYLSPFLKENIKNFVVFIVEDKVYKFGRIKDLK